MVTDVIVNLLMHTVLIFVFIYTHTLQHQYKKVSLLSSMDCGGPQVLHEGMLSAKLLCCLARNIPASAEFADCFMQQGPA